MRLTDLDKVLPLPGRKRPKKAASRPAPRSFLPLPAQDGIDEQARRLGAPRGGTSPAGPLDVARLDAARDRLRRQIAPVDDEL